MMSTLFEVCTSEFQTSNKKPVPECIPNKHDHIMCMLMELYSYTIHGMGHLSITLNSIRHCMKENNT